MDEETGAAETALDVTARVTASVVLLLLGVIAATTGVALIDVRAGIIVFGVLLLAIGALLGFA